MVCLFACLLACLLVCLFVCLFACLCACLLACLLACFYFFCPFGGDGDFVRTALLFLCVYLFYFL